MSNIMLVNEFGGGPHLRPLSRRLLFATLSNTILVDGFGGGHRLRPLSRRLLLSPLSNTMLLSMERTVRHQHNSQNCYLKVIEVSKVESIYLECGPLTWPLRGPEGPCGASNTPTQHTEKTLVGFYAVCWVFLDN